MRIDSDAVFSELQRQIATPGAVSARMRAVIAACRSGFPHTDWDALADLEFDSERERVQDFVHRLGKDPRAQGIRGLYVGIGQWSTERGETTADYYAGVAEAFDADDEALGWTYTCRYYPDYARAGSRIMDAIYGIAYRTRKDGLGNDAEWPLCLAYPTMLFHDVAQLLALSYGIAVGFDDGDVLLVHRPAG